MGEYHDNIWHLEGRTLKHSRTVTFFLCLFAASGALADAEQTLFIDDPFARAATPAARVGSAYFTITNTGPESRYLTAITSDIAVRAEFHTHSMQDGVMSMSKIDGDIEIAPGATVSFQRGGDHVMLMGLKHGLIEGETFDATLRFRNGEDIVLRIPVDLGRQ